MISKVVLQATSIDSRWRSSRCWGLLWQRHGEHEEHSGSTVYFVHVVDPGCARATTAGTRGAGGGGGSCGRPPRSVDTPFPIPTLPLVGAVKKMIGPVCRSPKMAWWSSVPAGVRWHCRLSPGTMSRSPGWAVGWSGHVSPERACGLASAPLGGRGGGWGVGGGGLHFTQDRTRLMHDTVSTPATGRGPGPVVWGSAPGHHPWVGG